MFGLEFNLRARSALRSHEVSYRRCNSPRMGMYCFLLILFCLVLCPPPVGGSDPPPCTTTSPGSGSRDGTKKAKILLLTYTDMPVPFADGINAGFFASLFSRNCTFIDNYTIEIVNKPTKWQDLAKSLDEVLSVNTDLLALAMLYGDTSTLTVLSTLEHHGMVLFSPVTGSTRVRVWNRHLYFLRPSPTGELFALLRYAVNTLHSRRLGFMYLQNVSFGDTEYKLAVDELGRMGLSICCTFRIESSITGSADAKKFKEAFDKFAEGRPQATILFGTAVADSKNFLMHFWTDPRTMRGMLLVPSSLHPLAILVHTGLAKNLHSDVPFNVIATGTNPLANDDSFEAIKRFQKDMRYYLNSSRQKDFKDTDIFLTNDLFGELMVFGWVIGEGLMQALSTLEWRQGRAAFMNSLYKQRRYVIDDLVIGDFGDNCSKLAAAQGAICECNQGGKTVFMNKITKDYRAITLPEGMMSFPPTDCFTNTSLLHDHLNSAMLYLQDSVISAKANFLMSTGISAARAFPDAFGKSVEFSVASIATKAATAVKELERTLLERDVDALVGVAPKGSLERDDLVFISPLFERPRLNVYYRHVISILPTVQQQFFTVSRYFQSTGIISVHALLRSDEGKEMVDILHKSLETFGVSLRSSRVLGDGEALDGKMPGTGVVLVVGLTASDVPVIAAYLESHEGSRVSILFEDLCVVYDELAAGFAGKEAAHRLLFVTNLPHWSDKATESKTGKMFFEAVANETLRTPLAMAGFAIARFAHHASAHLVFVNSKTFLDFIYATPMIYADDMLYGPFLDDKKCDKRKKANPMSCEVNFGATYMGVWSMARSLNPSVPPLSQNQVPSLIYRLSSSTTLSVNQLIAIVIGSLVALLLIIAIIIFAIFYYVKTKRNYYAPKDTEHPLTLIFTDIQSSTALWAACPGVMPDALEVHHRLIRRLIAKYRCYEVKTIGDSFMIACKSPYAAVQLMGDLQRTFLHHDWGTSAIDKAYHEFEEAQAVDDTNYKPPSARLDDAVYREYWSGLRVRAGVHTGLSDIRFDEVTKGYDYYGSTSNTAARTESVANGGQVLLTRAAYMALSTAERAGLNVTALGAVELRGVPKPVEMLQLNPVPGRAFAALRLGREEYVDVEFASSVSDGSVTVGTRLSSDLFLEELLRKCLNPMDPLRRDDVLRNLCSCWAVGVPRNMVNSALNEYSQVLIRKLAVKIDCALGPRWHRNIGFYEDDRFLRSIISGERSIGALSSAVADSPSAFSASSTSNCVIKIPMALLSEVSDSIHTILDTSSEIRL